MVKEHTYSFAENSLLVILPHNFGYREAVAAERFSKEFKSVSFYIEPAPARKQSNAIIKSLFFLESNILKIALKMFRIKRPATFRLNLDIRNFMRTVNQNLADAKVSKYDCILNLAGTSTSIGATANVVFSTFDFVRYDDMLRLAMLNKPLIGSILITENGESKNYILATKANVCELSRTIYEHFNELTELLPALYARRRRSPEAFFESLQNDACEANCFSSDN